MSATYLIAAIISLIIIAFGVVFAATAVWHLGKVAEDADADEAGFSTRGPTGGVWIVANPTKPANYPAFRKTVDEYVEKVTGGLPRWLETSVDDPGTGQAFEALRHKPQVVIAAGGDGTVRAVAAAMANSRVPMGLLPLGTGNLAARNLALPLTLEESLEVAVGDTSRNMDLAWLHLDGITDGPFKPAEGTILNEVGGRHSGVYPFNAKFPSEGEYAYLVIAGIGFDGETMAQTEPRLKQKVGWTAYVFTALKSLHIERMSARLTLHKAPATSPQPNPWREVLPTPVNKAVEATQTLGHEDGVSPAVSRSGGVEITEVRARTVLVANCGELPFVKLAPEAALDDGALDVIAIDTRAGLVGWAILAAKVLGHTLGFRSVNLRNDPASIQFKQASRASIRVSRPYPVQADGDAIAKASTMLTRVEKGALIVRVPADSENSFKA